MELTLTEDGTDARRRWSLCPLEMKLTTGGDKIYAHWTFGESPVGVNLIFGE